MTKRAIGVCYYPEHWPEAQWAGDAERMATAGITWVRIGEFAWARLEPEPGVFDWGWLDRAVETLGTRGLKVVMGTPSATPPRWMATRFPDMFACDAQGRPRGFGSRRHYDFSHSGYRGAAARMAGAMAVRYGANPHVAAWQIDNEYGCHDTVVSYSPVALAAFREWLARKYGEIDALNAAWGNVFWSMDYTRFDDIGLPNLTVTEANPAHVMDFRHFSSDQVVAFNRAQVEALRRHTEAPLIHNYMGEELAFDHFDLGADLDVASWDSYPLGFLLRNVEAPDAHKRAFLRQGDPDYQAFHHDIYRAVGRGRWWVMEQQPGPVNWAPWNLAPLPGMVRLWAWEAFAHGAEVVSYFRWRQAPFAQEAMHAGLLRPDGADAPGLAEAAQVARELADAPEAGCVRGDVALVFDYVSAWAWQSQPQGCDFDYFRLVFEIYRGLRKLGLNIDILPSDSATEGYALVLAPALAVLPEGLKRRAGHTLFGPRTGAKTAAFRTPTPLPPALSGFDCTVSRVESLPPDCPVLLSGGGAFLHWRELLEGGAVTEIVAQDGHPALMRQGTHWYLGGWPDAVACEKVLRRVCTAAGIPTEPLPDALRCRDTASHRIWLNYGTEEVSFGDVVVPGCGVVMVSKE